VLAGFIAKHARHRQPSRSDNATLAIVPGIAV
jgi:hypothetical protein